MLCCMVIIENLKGIKYHEFDVPIYGVYMLTGCIGCGKTPLLITLSLYATIQTFQA